jgi:energy-coupling factor transporter ATP-binding protein EcfA2
LDNFTDKEAVILARPPTAEANTIGFRRATFSWAVEDVDGSVTPSKRAFRLHIDNELTFQRGAINLIVGPTGSGKTCMLLALLGTSAVSSCMPVILTTFPGEMHFIPQRPDSWYNLPRQHGVSYAPQESWVLNDTIRVSLNLGLRV